jgi:hypothetical protein
MIPFFLFVILFSAQVLSAETTIRPGWTTTSYAGTLEQSADGSAMEANLELYGGFDLFTLGPSLNIEKATKLQVSTHLPSPLLRFPLFSFFLNVFVLFFQIVIGYR